MMSGEKISDNFGAVSKDDLQIIIQKISKRYPWKNPFKGCLFFPKRGEKSQKWLILQNFEN